MKVRTEQTGDTAIIYLSGELNLANSETVERELHKSLDNKKRIIVDLTELRSVDSMGIATLVNALKVSRDKNLEFALRGVSGSVGEVLKVTRLDSIFPRVEENPSEG